MEPTDNSSNPKGRSSLAESKSDSTNNIILRTYSLSYLYTRLFGGQVWFNRYIRKAKYTYNYFPISKIVSPEGEVLFDECDLGIDLGIKERTDYIKGKVLSVIGEITKENIKSFTITKNAQLNNLSPDFQGVIDMKTFQDVYGRMLYNNLLKYPRKLLQIILCSMEDAQRIGLNEGHYLFQEDITSSSKTGSGSFCGNTCGSNCKISEMLTDSIISQQEVSTNQSNMDTILYKLSEFSLSDSEALSLETTTYSQHPYEQPMEMSEECENLVENDEDITEGCEKEEEFCNSHDDSDFDEGFGGQSFSKFFI
ncbi:hypothetical protein QTN25_008787 [Entamoeba marina]